jgi:hypothetical protein
MKAHVAKSRIAEGGLFATSLQQAVTAPGQLVGDQVLMAVGEWAILAGPVWASPPILSSGRVWAKKTL